MNPQSLSDLIALGEGSTAEFKRAMPSDLGREIYAFANATGGVILLGVADAGEIVGVADHNPLKSRVQSTARSADPPISVEVESVGEVLCVVVPRQERKPYSFGGRFFIRDGASSQQMSNAEVENLFYAVGRLHFDKKPCGVFSMESDLDDETWARFSERAKVPLAMDRVVALRNLGLVDAQDRMTHAGAWLLARDIRMFTTSAHVSCALFMGTEKVRILDRRDFHSDIPTMIDEAVAWILRKGPMAKSALVRGLGQKAVSGQLNKVIRALLSDGAIEYTIPQKPNSRLQQYRLTDKGRALQDRLTQSQ